MNLTAPKGNIPIGYVQAGGQRLPVTIDGEWLRYLSQGLLERVGGTGGTSLGDVGTVAAEALARTWLSAPAAQPPVEWAQWLGMAQTFLPRVTPQQRTVDDAEAVIANKVFNR